jgi:hypothetical protein
MREITLRRQNGFTIERVRNGWMIHTWTTRDAFSGDAQTVVAVAETPETLVELVREWAARQAAPEDSA